MTSSHLAHFYYWCAGWEDCSCPPVKLAFFRSGRMRLRAFDDLFRNSSTPSTLSLRRQKWYNCKNRPDCPTGAISPCRWCNQTVICSYYREQMRLSDTYSGSIIHGFGVWFKQGEIMRLLFIYGFDLQTACDGTRGEGEVGFCRVRDGS